MIDINWLRKELAEAVYNGELTGEAMEAVFKILGRWKEEKADER